ncbi:MAG: fatty acid desaturase [Pseudomonadota bacterium]
MRFEGVPTPGEQVIPDTHNFLKIIFLFALLLGAFSAAVAGVVQLERYQLDSWMAPAAKWTWLLLMGVIASAAVQGLGVLAHDAVHKVLFGRLWLNELAGGIISAFSLLPFNANRRFHLLHHRFSHQRDRDPEQPMHKHNLLFAISGGSLIALFLQYRMLLSNLFAASSEQQRRFGAVKDLIYLSMGFGSYFILLPWFGLDPLYTFVPLFLTLPVVFGIRAISDHYGLPEVVQKRPQQDAAAPESNRILYEVGGWVILTHPFIEWLWSNVNYHEVHHKFPYLSHRYLKSTFAATRNALPYAVADGYLRNLWRHRKRRYYQPD